MSRPALLLALCLGCVSAEVTAPEGTAYEPRPVGYPIAVFVAPDAPRSLRRALEGMAERRPLPAHDEVGHLEIETGEVASWSTVVLAAREEARRIGGDAIEALDFEEDRDRGRVLSARVLRYR